MAATPLFVISDSTIVNIPVIITDKNKIPDIIKNTCPTVNPSETVPEDSWICAENPSAPYVKKAIITAMKYSIPATRSALNVPAAILA